MNDLPFRLHGLFGAEEEVRQNIEAGELPPELTGTIICAPELGDYDEDPDLSWAPNQTFVTTDGHWIEEDPIADRGGDPNLDRYVQRDAKAEKPALE